MLLITIAAFISLAKIKNTIDTLKLNEYRFKSIFNGIDHYIMLLDSRLNILEVNNAVLDFEGVGPGELENRSLFESLYWTTATGSRDILEKAIEDMRKGIFNRHEVLSLNWKGELKFIDFSVYPVKNTNSHPMLYIAEGKDITDIKKKEEIIYRLAYYDNITGLSNDTLFAQTVTELINSGEYTGSILAVIKLSSLSFVSSVLSYDTGNELLRSFTKMLEENFKNLCSDCVLGKLSGGNFAVFIPQTAVKSKTVINYLNSLCKSEESLEFDNQKMHISINIGAAIFPDHGSTYAELLKNAMTAKDDSKIISSQCVEIFDLKTAEKMRRKAIIEEVLRSDTLEESLSVCFQPLVEQRSGNIIGFEALSRCEFNAIGKVSPSEFISIAEKTGTIKRIFSYVIEHAAKLVSLGNNSSPYISVNVSAMQLMDEKFPDILRNTIEYYNIPASSIPIEITESIFIDSMDTALSILNRLRDAGFLIFLDDFGTGFSSLPISEIFQLMLLKLIKILSGISILKKRF